MRAPLGLGAAIALAERPEAALPAFVALAGHADREVEPFEPRPVPRLPEQRGDIELAVRRMGDDRIGHALLADEGGERARVDAADADDVARLQP